MKQNNVLRYPKTPNLWKQKKKRIIRKVTVDEFIDFDEWRVLEKIDGANIRIIYSSVDNSLEIDSRYENDLIDELREKIEELVTIEKMREVFPEKDGKPSQIVLFGEGVGKRIGKFGVKNFRNYDFYLFDVFVFDQSEQRRNIRGWWLSVDNMIDVAGKLGIKHVPDLGVMTFEKLIEYVVSRPTSKVAVDIAEGIIAKCTYNVLNREGSPLQFKLKVSDYVKLDKQCPNCKHITSLRIDYEPVEMSSPMRYEYWDCEQENCNCHGACEIEMWI